MGGPAIGVHDPTYWVLYFPLQTLLCQLLGDKPMEWMTKWWVPCLPITNVRLNLVMLTMPPQSQGS